MSNCVIRSFLKLVFLILGLLSCYHRLKILLFIMEREWERGAIEFWLTDKDFSTTFMGFMFHGLYENPVKRVFLSSLRNKIPRNIWKIQETPIEVKSAGLCFIKNTINTSKAKPGNTIKRNFCFHAYEKLIIH